MHEPDAALQQTKSCCDGCQIDDFWKMGIGEIMLAEPVSHDMVNQCRGGQNRLLLPFGIEGDPSVFGLIRARQTAEAFAGTAASAPTTALFYFFR